MTEDTLAPILRHVTSSSSVTDLRRVGAHPDYWYPVAWSHELAPGKALGRRFAGEEFQPPAMSIAGTPKLSRTPFWCISHMVE